MALGEVFRLVCPDFRNQKREHAPGSFEIEPDLRLTVARSTDRLGELVTGLASKRHFRQKPSSKGAPGHDEKRNAETPSLSH
jgi:hypothetical protein